MSKVYFTSDLHFGHKNIGKYRSMLSIYSESTNREAICREWCEKIKKRDVVWVLGDCCFEKEYIADIAKLPGKKRIVLGNHDIKDAGLFCEAFDQIYGIKRYKNFWLSHAPIDSSELRGYNNIHGHIHMEPQVSENHYNVSCDYLKVHLNSFFVELNDIKEYFNTKF